MHARLRVSRATGAIDSGVGVVAQKTVIRAMMSKRPPAAARRRMAWMGTWTAPCIINEGVLARMIMPAARAVDVCAEQGKDMAGSCGRRQKSTRRAQRELH